MRRLALGLLAIVLAAPASAAAPAPRVLFTAKGPIEGLARDGGQVGWFRPCLGVHVLSLPSRRVARAGERRSGPCEGHLEGFAVGRGQVLWSESSCCGNFTETTVFAATPGGEAVRHERLDSVSAVPSGEYVTGAAGDGALLVYAVVRLAFDDRCNDGPEPCFARVGGGRLMRVTGRRPVRVPGVPPAALVAAGAGRVAVVNVAPLLSNDDLVQAGVTIHEGITGKRLLRVVPDGSVTGMALSRDVLALLVRKGGALAIARYELPSGRTLGSTRVYANATDLSIAGTRIVFRSGGAIRLLEARTGRSRVLARRSQATSPKVEGDQVVWIEGRRIVALDL